MARVGHAGQHSSLSQTSGCSSFVNLSSDMVKTYKRGTASNSTEKGGMA
jgi:hypothetical protein